MVGRQRRASTRPSRDGPAPGRQCSWRLERGGFPRVSPDRRAFRARRGMNRRAGGTRTPNRRFWRPVRYQLRHCPSSDPPNLPLSTGRSALRAAHGVSVGNHRSASLRIRRAWVERAPGFVHNPPFVRGRSRDRDAKMGTMSEQLSSPVPRAVPRARVSRRIGGIAESATLAVDAKAKALKAAGRPVIGFGAGEPDFPTPDVHRGRRGSGLRRSRRTTGTPPPPAFPSCARRSPRRPCATPARGRPRRSGLVTNGGKQAVYQAFATLVDPGDEVLLPAPYWTTYPEAIRPRRGRPRRGVRWRGPGLPGHRRAARGRAHAAHQGAAVLLAVQPDRRRSTPRRRSKRSAEWALEHGIWVITDEIYEHLVVRRRPSSLSMPVAVPELADTCVVLNGVAKTYAMTGWRVGWMIGPARRHQGRDEPAVAPDVERRQRLPARARSPRSGRSGGRRARCARPSTGAGTPWSRCSTRSTGSCARRRRARSTSTPRSRASWARRSAGRAPDDLGRAGRRSSSTRPRSPSCPARPSGPSGYLRLSYALGDDDLVTGVSRLASLLAEAR